MTRVARDASANNLFPADNDYDDMEVVMVDGLEDLNDYSADCYCLNEHQHFYMDWHPILSQNPIAVEFVYMLEAKTLVPGSVTVGRGDMKQQVHRKYIELI